MTEFKWNSTLERLRNVFGEFRKVRKKMIAKDKASKPREKAYILDVGGASSSHVNGSSEQPLRLLVVQLA